MDNVRCYFKDGKALGRIDVSMVDDCETAILEVKQVLSLEIPFGQKLPTVLAVAK